MKFAKHFTQLIHFFCASTMMVVMASAAKDCKIQDYHMEIFIGANANHCTPTEMKKVDQSMDKVIYQIFPTIRGLERADMIICSLKPRQDDFRRQLGTGRRCRFCGGANLDACGNCWRRDLERCRHQSWRPIANESRGNELSLTKENTVQQTIKLSSRTTYVKADFMLFQQSNNIIEVTVNGRSPVQLEYIENETSRFRKNGILSASQNYIRDDEGNLKYTKVALHVDLSQLNEYGFDDDDEDKELLLQFEMIPTDNNEEEQEQEDDNKEAAIISRLVMKGAKACGIEWSKANADQEEQQDEPTSNNSMTAFERQTEWILSDKLTAVLNAISDANVNHCLHNRDPIVNVNLYKISAGDGEGKMLC